MNISKGAVVLALLGACAGAQVSEKAMEQRPEGSGTVTVRIEGVESSTGSVYASIYLTPEGFPEDKALAYIYQSAQAEAVPVQFTFEDIPAGWIAVAVLHDEDMNGELTLSRLGIPKEDYGFSLNPDSFFGPPAFDEAAVLLEQGQHERLVVEIQ